MIVNPASGALVRDPVTKLAIEPGAEIDLNDPYWARLFADGDVVPAAPAAPASDAPASTRRLTTSNEDAA